jgi:hypothetical protein
MALDPKTARALYRKLLNFYPKEFKGQLGESMEQTFNDRLNERKQKTHRIGSGYLLGLYIETAAGITKEHMRSITQGNIMKNILTNPTSTAIISTILALPVLTMFLLLILNIEPPLGPLEPILKAPPDQPNVAGSLVALTLFLLLPVAFVINLIPIVQNMRAGNSITAYPVNLAIAIGIFLVFASIIAALVIDQYPCWIGVPNCD